MNCVCEIVKRGGLQTAANVDVIFSKNCVISVKRRNFCTLLLKHLSSIIFYSIISSIDYFLLLGGEHVLILHEVFHCFFLQGYGRWNTTWMIEQRFYCLSFVYRFLDLGVSRSFDASDTPSDLTTIPKPFLSHPPLVLNFRFGTIWECSFSSPCNSFNITKEIFVPWFMLRIFGLLNSPTGPKESRSPIQWKPEEFCFYSPVAKRATADRGAFSKSCHKLPTCVLLILPRRIRSLDPSHSATTTYS